MTKDPCTVVSVPVSQSVSQSVPLLCFALGCDKIHIVVNKKKENQSEKSVAPVALSSSSSSSFGYDKSDMTRSTLPLTKKIKNQSKHQLFGLLREVCTVITDYCVSDANRMEKIHAEKIRSAISLAVIFEYIKLNMRVFTEVFFFPPPSGKEFLFDVKVTIIHP
jgi:hypothetical protein